MINITIGDWEPCPARLEQGTRVFAIGDIHGSLDHQVALEDAIRHDIADGPYTLVRTGDYIDRGPDSKGVLQRLADHPAIDLMGNHDLFLRAVVLDTPSADDQAATWMLNGGFATIAQFGIPIRDIPKNPAQLGMMLRDVLGPNIIDAVLALRPWHRIGNVLFVHGGVHPAVPVDEFLAVDPDEFDGAENAHWAWIRRPFLKHEGAFGDGLLVVHGHTPEATQGLHNGNRISLDSLRSSPRMLTAAEIVDGRFRLIRAQG